METLVPTVPTLWMPVVVLPLKSIVRGRDLQCGKRATKLCVPFDLVILLLGINPWEIIQRKEEGEAV